MPYLEIKAKQNGSYVITGVVTYTDAEGKEQTTTGTAIHLCRCGQSGNKPFCDGSHRRANFKAPEIILHLKE